MLAVLEILYWIVSIVFNWRMCICIIGAAACGLLLGHLLDYQPWTTVITTHLIIAGAILGYRWERKADAETN